MNAPRALDDLRVLDLTEAGGQYAAKLLADLGADVVRVEPPGGVTARTAPPFAGDLPDADRSVPFWYWNTGKRSLTLDLTTEDGRALLQALVPRFDALIHTQPPPGAAAHGLDGETLRALHPGLITCSITPFGETGPHTAYEGGELVVTAMSGLTWLAGYPDRPPTTPPGEQAAVCGGLQAAQGILLALAARDLTGRGQHVEVSQQEALLIAQETAMQTWDMRRELRTRTGAAHTLPAIGVYACADGYIQCMVGAAGFGAPLSTLVEWMAEEGQAGGLDGAEWDAWLPRLTARELTVLAGRPEELRALQARIVAADGVVAAFFAGRSKHELYLGGQRRRLMIGPVSTTADLTADPQLAARGWWRAVAHPELDRDMTYPGPPYHLARTPWTISRRPPLVGEHTVEILRAELALAPEQIETLMGAGII
ncbi:MAG: CoA transferase [Dehalococcoidia bacterium]